MNLLRASARTMMAGYFVTSGAQALKDPEPFVAEHERFANTVVPLAKRVAPAEVATSIPEDTVTLVRISAAMRLLGGLGLITGKGRRLGAGMLALSMVPQVMASNPFGGDNPEERAAKRTNMLKDVALLGGAMIAAGDTEGKPGLTWRAQDSSRRLAKNVESTKKDLSKGMESTKKDLSKSLGGSNKGFAKTLDSTRKDLVKAIADSPAKDLAKQFNETGTQLLSAGADLSRRQLAKQTKAMRKDAKVSANARAKQMRAQAEANRKQATRDRKQAERELKRARKNEA